MVARRHGCSGTDIDTRSNTAYCRADQRRQQLYYRYGHRRLTDAASTSAPARGALTGMALINAAAPKVNHMTTDQRQSSAR
jgi:hypothetical protein